MFNGNKRGWLAKQDDCEVPLVSDSIDDDWWIDKILWKLRQSITGRIFLLFLAPFAILLFAALIIVAFPSLILYKIFYVGIWRYLILVPTSWIYSGQLFFFGNLAYDHFSFDKNEEGSYREAVEIARKKVNRNRLIKPTEF